MDNLPGALQNFWIWRTGRELVANGIFVKNAQIRNCQQVFYGFKLLENSRQIEKNSDDIF